MDKPLDDMRAWIRDIEQDKVSVIVSSIVCAEVLDNVGTDQAGTDFRGWVKRNNVLQADASWRIAEMAVGYREKVRIAQKLRLIRDGFKAPDALIAATAVYYKAQVLHSFDPVLNLLSGSNIIDFLCVERPLYTIEPQPMFDDDPVEPEALHLPNNWAELLTSEP